MRNAQQRGALCAHGELRNCLYQRQFRARRRHTTLVPPRGCRTKRGGRVVKAYAAQAQQPLRFASLNTSPYTGETFPCAGGNERRAGRKSAFAANAARYFPHRERRRGGGMFALPVQGRVPNEERREGCKGIRRAGTTTPPFRFAQHLPLHRGGFPLRRGNKRRAGRKSVFAANTARYFPHRERQCGGGIFALPVQG